eukprot:278188_1
MLAIAMNTLHTKTVITIGQKLSFLDVLSNIGGIFGLIWPASIIILGYLVSGFKFKNISIPGLAPNFGLHQEEKRKISLYLKEIDVVCDDKQNNN